MKIRFSWTNTRSRMIGIGYRGIAPTWKEIDILCWRKVLVIGIHRQEKVACRGALR